MLIDKTMVKNGYQPLSAVDGNYLHTLTDIDRDGIYRPTFTKVSCPSSSITPDDEKFEDIVIYDGGGVW